jgi:RND family efflux transporter MFP subunit
MNRDTPLDAAPAPLRDGTSPTSRRLPLGSVAIVLAVVAVGAVLATWKVASLRAAGAASAQQVEPMESVTVAAARPVEHRRTTTSIGTVLAMQSVTLRNELPGTVRRVALVPGTVVEAGTLLVALDVAVEEAELRAQQAQAALAEAQLARIRRLRADGIAPEMEFDRAVAERDVALAQIARTKAVIERKTIRAPFRARVGIADVHVGQYLGEGTQLTTLQSVADDAHVDFAVTQDVAAGLRVGFERGTRIQDLLLEFSESALSRRARVHADPHPSRSDALTARRRRNQYSSSHRTSPARNHSRHSSHQCEPPRR